ncbi:hypothetical protein ACFVAV_30895 [Nocardia sp. NPDC057663]|uniref:hypothetical protein n=1 Tax=Nocardia sp. NPDC057663 TaxID=3346201 RepID=UPI0036712CBE
MSTALVVGGSAFLVALLWREFLIGWSTLRPTERLGSSLLSGYYARMTEATCSCGVVGMVIVLMIAGLAVQLTRSDRPVWAGLSCVGLLTVFVVLSLLRTRVTARLLAVGTECLDIQAVTTRLLRHHIAYMTLLVVIVAIQLAAVEEGAGSEAFAVGGASFLAATLWNEVMIDRPATPLADMPSERDRSTLIGYYKVMTATLVRPNLAAVSIAVSTTLAALVAQLLGNGAPRWATSMSFGIFVVFLVLAGIRTWPTAVRLGSGSEPVEKEMYVGRKLGQYHLAFVIMLATVVGIQLAGQVGEHVHI